MTSEAQTRIERLVSRVETLPVDFALLQSIGLASGAGLAAYSLFASRGAAGNFDLYLAFGLLFAAAAFALSFGRLENRGFGKFLGLFGLFSAAVFVFAKFAFTAFFLAAVQAAVLAREAENRSVKRVLALFAVAAVGWNSARRTITWDSSRHFLIGSVFVVIAGIFASVLAARFTREGARESSGKGVTAVFASILLLAIGASAPPRADAAALFFHHWGVIIGSGQMLREGGVPFVDVPMQYGFLNYLPWAYARGTEIFTAFFRFEAVIGFASSLILFSFLFRAFRGKGATLYAGLLACVGSFAIPGWCIQLRGVAGYPSSGAFRFFWITLAFAFVARLVLRERVIARTVILLVSCALFAVGSVYSAESFFCCTALLGPVFAGYAILEFRERKRISPCLPWVIGPLLAFAIAIFASSLFLRSFDPERIPLLEAARSLLRAFDFARSFAGGFMKDAIDPLGGAVGTLVLLSAGVALTRRFLRTDAGTPARPEKAIASIALVSGLWGVSSHYVGRGHENNWLSLTPFLWIYAVTLFEAAAPYPPLRFAVRSLFIVMIVFVSAIVLRQPDAWPKVVWNLSLDPIAHTRDLLPRSDSQLESLARRAGFKPTDALIATQVNLPPLLQSQVDAGIYAHRPWSSLFPAALLAPLGSATGEEYLRRFARIGREGGWLLEQDDATPPPISGTAFRFFESEYLRGETYANGRWRLTRYRRRR